MFRARPPSRALLAALAVALFAMGAGGTAHGQLVFDPDGPGGPNGDRSILGLDYLPGNSVSLAAVPLLPVGSTFFNLYQAKLGATTGTTTSIPGLNGADTNSDGLFDAGSFEITVVARINEVVNNVSIAPSPPAAPIVATALFTSAADQSMSFLEIYYDDLSGQPIASAANDLLGTGFTDGLLILNGQILPGNFGDSNFTTQFTQIGLLDQAGADNRGGQLSVTGSGGSLISTSVTSYNMGFFKTPGITIVRTDFNTSLVDPFREVNPSITFFAGDPDAVTPVLGTVNGLDGPDFQFQADANQSFVTQPAVVPEPGTMILAVTGLITVSLGSLRKLRRRPAAPAA